MRRLTPETGWRSPLGVDKLEMAQEQVPSTREENAHGEVYRAGRARVKLHVRGGGPEREAAGAPGGGDERAGVGGRGSGDTGHATPVPGGRDTVGLALRGALAARIRVGGGGSEREPGRENDKLDAFARAEQLRIGAIQKKVYKGQSRFARLRHLAKGYAKLVGDSVRVQNRIKSLLRSRGLAASGQGVYARRSREEWLSRLPDSARPQAKLLYRQHDALVELRKVAQKAMVAEARRHSAFRLVRTCPGLGPVGAAELVAVVVTPYRFRNKRKFWKYCGLGIVMRTRSRRSCWRCGATRRPTTRSDSSR